MKIKNPLSVKGTEEPIQPVLRAIAGQGGCDGTPYDEMMAAADYIDAIEKEIKELKCCGNCAHPSSKCECDFIAEWGSGYCDKWRSDGMTRSRREIK